MLAILFLVQIRRFHCMQQVLALHLTHEHREGNLLLPKLTPNQIFEKPSQSAFRLWVTISSLGLNDSQELREFYLPTFIVIYIVHHPIYLSDCVRKP